MKKSFIVLGGVAVLAVVALAMMASRSKESYKGTTPVSGGPDNPPTEASEPSAGVQKPAKYPADIPTAAGAYGFSYEKKGVEEHFGYQLPITKDINTQYADVKASVLAAGWKEDPVHTKQMLETFIMGLVKGDQALSVIVQQKDDYYIVGFNRQPVSMLPK